MKARQNTRVLTSARGSYRTTRGMQRDVELADLSRGGCRVYDEAGQLRLGEYVRFFIAGTGPHMAEAVWRNGENVGLAFLRPLPPRLFETLASAQWDDAQTVFDETREEGLIRRFV